MEWELVMYVIGFTYCLSGSVAWPSRKMGVVGLVDVAEGAQKASGEADCVEDARERLR